MALQIVQAASLAHIETTRDLFNQYAASLNFNLCFQSFEEELARLPGEYAPWSGVLLLGLVDDQAAGCVALHRLEGEMAGAHGELFGGSDVCEMKRLFVRPEFRGCGLGRELIDSVLTCAAAIGYRRMRLDTIPTEMGRAVDMYRKLGFVEIAPYRANPIGGAKYMELDLAAWAARTETAEATEKGRRNRG